MIDAMAETYHVLPSKLLEEGNTLDIQIFNHVQTHKARQQKLKAGEDITETYRPEELEALWQERTQR